MKRFCLAGCAVLGLVVIVLLCIPVFMRNTLPPGHYSCQSNLKQIALGIFMYAQDYDEKLPPAIFQKKTVGWANGIQPYLKSTRIFQCPEQWHPETPAPDEPGFTDYWMNSNIAGLENKKITNSEQIIILGDGDGDSPESTASYAINQLPASWLQSSDSPAKRHLGGANYAFADGHVKLLQPEQVTQEKPAKNKDVYTFRIK